MMKRHPNTRFILAHFGWHGNDLARAGKLLDENPNVFYDVAAVLYDFGRQPRAAHDFFVKYQDRILFGKDSYQPDEYPYYWRVFETNDEYFDYYRDYHAFWKLYGIGLPDRRAAEALLPERAEGDAGTVARGVHGLDTREQCTMVLGENSTLRCLPGSTLSAWESTL